MRAKKGKKGFPVTLVFSGLLLLSPGSAFPQVPFYEGKTITIIHGRDAGGSGDLRVKAMTSFLQKYIPGHPTITHEYMPGGGGRKAANHIYSVAVPDGLTMGNIGGGIVANAVLGAVGVQYNLDRLIFLGSPYSATNYVFMTRKAVGLTGLEKLRATPGVRVGSQSVGHTNYIIGRIMVWLLDLKDVKYVAGFSVPERDVAFLRGEIDAIATSDVSERYPDWMEKNLVDFHVVLNVPKENKALRLEHLPELETFARTELERRLLALFRTFRQAGSPFILPLGTPKERVEILREAIRKTFRDPEFHRQYKKVTREEPTPLMPEANEKAIKELPRDPEVIDLFKKLSGADALPAR